MQPITRRQVCRRLGGLACSLAALTSTRADESPSAAERIKVGQIGVGHAHASKISVYRDSPDYEVVGIVEPDPELRRQALGQPSFQDLPWMTEEQLLNIRGLQVVLVETRVRDLLAVAERCIMAGKHVHVDKPAGSSLPDYQRLLNLAATKNLMVQMGYMYRYNPAMMLLHDFLRKGWLGDVFEVHTVMSKVVDPDSRRKLAEFPGGIMFELGCHIIDLVVGVLGAPAKVTGYSQRTSVFDDGLADNMLAVLEYPTCLATVRSTALEVEGFARRHFLVCGTKGTFHIQPLDKPTARVALSQRRGDYPGGYQDITFPKFQRYVADAADMAKVIRGLKKSDFDYQHDLAVQTTLLEACRHEPAAQS